MPEGHGVLSSALREPVIAASKIVVPSVPLNVLARERLLERLSAATAHVSLVCAEAGSGKSLLLSSWVSGGRAPGPVAWVSLEPHDDTPATLWRWIAGAVEHAVGTRPSFAEPDEAPLAVARVASELDRPLVLVLDDVHELDHADVLRQLDALTRATGDRFRLVLAGRREPRVALHRLRLAGTVAELRGRDLAFTPAESVEVLRCWGAELTEEDAALLHHETEGWAAGLRLAALSLVDGSGARRIVEPARHGRELRDYLLHEVLDHLDGETRRFLLRTSVPDLLTSELADRLAQQPGSGRILDDLERANAFVSCRRSEPPVYRYHPLFAGFLRGELERELPEELEPLHRTAAAWLGANGEPVSAVRHAVAGRDWQKAAELAGDNWVDLLAQGTPLLRELVGSLPRDRPREPELLLLQAIAFHDRGDHERARRRLADAAARAEDLPPERFRPFRRFQGLARIYEGALRWDMEAVATSARDLLEAADDAPDARARRQARATGLVNIGMTSLMAGDLDRAELHVEEALELARTSGAHHVALNALGQRAWIELSRGGLRRASALADEALALARERRLEGEIQTLPAHFTLGWTEYHLSRLDRAHDHARAATELARRREFRVARALAALLLARVLGAQGATDTSLRQLRAVLPDLAGAPVPPYEASVAAGLEARLLLQRGESGEAALAALGRAEPRPELALVAARLALAAGRPADALERLAAAAPSIAHPAARIEAHLLETLAALAAADEARAHAALERALELAAPEGYRQVFAEAGPALEPLLRDHIRRSTAFRAFAGELLAEPGADTELAGLELSVPLTERERAVLGYLPTMMSNEEIARELYVSVNTVKTHLRNVYRKLGARSRRDAVKRGRRLGLL